MDTIVLSKEQKLAIEYDKPGAYAIEGIAGSGKTTVGIHRIPFLLDKCDEDDDVVMVVTFHKTLVNYLEYLIQTQLESGIIKSLFSNKNTWNNKLRVVPIDDLMDKYYNIYRIKNKAKYPTLNEFVSNKETLTSVIKEALFITRTKFNNVDILDDKNIDFLLEEVQYLISNRIDSLWIYQGYIRKGRNKFSDIKKNLRTKSRTRQAIFELRSEYIRTLLKKGLMDRYVKRRLALITIQENPPQDITHLIIDEAQDLDKVRFDFLKYFPKKTNNASATFLYDPAQSIHANSWLGSGHSFKELGIDIIGRKRVLYKNFRTTLEIQTLAKSILKNVNDYDINIELTNKSDVKPFLVNCNSTNKQLDFIFNIIKTIEVRSLKDIIIAGRDKYSLKIIETELNKKGLKCNIINPRDKTFGHDNIRIMTLQATKGLESESMILVDINEGIIPSINTSEQTILRERKLLYVAMTRATKYLYILSSGEQSSFLNNVNSELIHVIEANDVLEFIPVADPEGKIKFDNIYSQFENVFKNISNLNTLNINNREQFEKMSEIIFSCSSELDIISKKFDELSYSIDSRTLLYKNTLDYIADINKLIVLEKKKLIKKLNDPVSLAEIEVEVRDSYPNFSEKSLNTLKSVSYKIKHALININSDDLDWGPEMTSFSKIFETEAKNIYQNNKWDIKETKLTFYIDDLHSKGAISKFQQKKLNDFRWKRNRGTHNNGIRFEVLKDNSSIFIGDNGIFNILNKLLEN